MEKELILKLVERMKLINGPDEKCCFHDPTKCPNHALIHEAEQYLKDSEAVR